jgi:BirA family biotin operon repressor/biotin-[acetyl-CoA-carboxylase] ligase
VTTEVAGERLAELARHGGVHLLDQVSSTNDYALHLASRHTTTVVVARRQTKGRGRFRRSWYSDDDSLTASLLLHTNVPDFPQPSFLTHLAGLALGRAIDAVAELTVYVSWPNDIVCNGKKLAGILCEQRGHAVAVGVGLNVNQERFPQELPDAGSLRMATGQSWDRFLLLEAFLREMFGCVERAGKGDTAHVLTDIRSRSAIIQRRVEVQTLLRKHVGTVVDFDAEGRLVLRTDSGRLVVLGVGDVRKLI